MKIQTNVRDMFDYFQLILEIKQKMYEQINFQRPQVRNHCRKYR
jgi:hypothetical protein